MNITQDQARQRIQGVNDDKIFTVTFVKRTNGELRVMNCRRGVRKGVTGEGLKFDPSKKGLVGVFDMQIGQHRFISLDSIKKIKMKGKTYDVV